jgi:hypothetical protein
VTPIWKLPRRFADWRHIPIVVTAKHGVNGELVFLADVTAH